MNVLALLRVHRRIWTKNGYMEMKEVDKYTCICVILSKEELEQVLKRAS